MISKNLKRKEIRRQNGLTLLFDESKEDMIMGNIDERKKLLANGDKVNLKINIHVISFVTEVRFYVLWNIGTL